MKYISKVIDIILITIVCFLLVSSIGTAVIKRPFLMTVIRSNSMYPLMQRGDTVLVSAYGTREVPQIGDIVIFKTDEGSYSDKGWIAHRIIKKDTKGSFITKGDANLDTDQQLGGAPAISKQNIGCKIIVSNDIPIKIPYIGHISLFMEDFNKNKLMIPALIFVMMIILAINELRGTKQKKKRRSRIDLPLIYIVSGLVISIIFATTMLMENAKYNMTYNVSNDKGILMGSDIGVLKIGENVTKELSGIENRGIFPSIITVTTNDSQISSNISNKLISPHEKVNVVITINPRILGKYKSNVYVGRYLPFLPSEMILAVAKRNQLLAIIMVALVPGLLIMSYPFLNRRLRAIMFKEIRRSLGRFKKKMPLNI